MWVQFEDFLKVIVTNDLEPILGIVIRNNPAAISLKCTKVFSAHSNYDAHALKHPAVNYIAHRNSL